MEIDTWGVLEIYIENAVREALKEVGEKVNHRMREFIDRDVYDVNPNNYDGSKDTYETTYQLRESVTTSEVGHNPEGYEVEVYHDTEKIVYNGDLFQHGSSKDISEWIPEIIAFNKSGNLFGSNQWWHKRNSYFYDTLDNLKNSGELTIWFTTALSKYGLSK